jgi:hypothetical protein
MWKGELSERGLAGAVIRLRPESLATLTKESRALMRSVKRAKVHGLVN